MIKHRQDSIQELAQKRKEVEELKQKLKEQKDLNELLKGCIMELADVVFGEEEPTA